MNKEPGRVERLVGGYEILGAVTGLLTMVWASLRYPAALPGGSLATALPPFLVLGVAGQYLRADNPRGLSISLIMQGLQLVAWSGWNATWKFSAGLYASAGIVARKLDFFMGWDTSLVVGIGAGRPVVAIVVNLVPAAIMLALVIGRRHGVSEAPSHRARLGR